MLKGIAIIGVGLLSMLLPYLPGRFDASAATLSFVVQVASLASLPLVLAGLAWMVSPRNHRTWRRIGVTLAGLVVLIGSLAAASVNQLSLGILLGTGGMVLVRNLLLSLRSSANDVVLSRRLAVTFTVVPLVLVGFMIFALPRAAAWSRDRAIAHSSPLIAEIERFKQRNGHYPPALQSLNPDVPTGVVGIERFTYEPTGLAYNLYFVRQSIALDAKEVVMFNPLDQHQFTSHELDVLQYDGDQLALRRGDRRRTQLAQAHWISILFD